MGGLARLFANRLMLLVWDDRLIGTPEVGICRAAAVGSRHSVPQPPAAGFASITDRVRDNLSCRAREGDPNPGRMHFLEHERPQLVQFQRCRVWVAWIGWQQRCAQGWEGFSLFFSQAVPVLRDTPNVRSRPRKLLRS